MVPLWVENRINSTRLRRVLAKIMNKYLPKTHKISCFSSRVGEGLKSPHRKKAFVSNSDVGLWTWTCKESVSRKKADGNFTMKWISICGPIIFL